MTSAVARNNVRVAGEASAVFPMRNSRSFCIPRASDSPCFSCFSHICDDSVYVAAVRDPPVNQCFEQPFLRAIIVGLIDYFQLFIFIPEPFFVRSIKRNFHIYFFHYRQH